MLELHYYPSNASLAPHMLLEEIGAPYALRLVDRTQGAHKSAEYLKLNPNGLIPVLVDGELVLYESAAICLHLVDQHPQAGLAPAVATPARAHFYKWLMWLTNTLQPAIIAYYYPERWADTPDAVAQVQASAERRVGELLDLLDAELARHGGPWLLGDQCSAVDFFALMLCRWTRSFARPARSLPHLGPYLSRMLERPSVIRVFEQEGLQKPWV
jgi:glutathione S-transferase